MSLKHNIPLQIQSTSSNCVQTSTSQFLSFYGLSKSPEIIEASVPVRLNTQGNPMGTLFADIGTWLKQTTDLEVTMHVFDTQIIDRSWKDLSEHQILDQLLSLQEHGISTARSPYAPLLIDAYITYLQAGGLLNIVKCTNQLLQSLLQTGPVLAIISFNYLYDYPRATYDKGNNEYKANSADGKAIEHAIVLTGYDGNNYFYNDPDSEYGGQQTIADDVLIGAICTAQLNSDNYLLSVEK
jgi:hypothetical protein